MSTSLPEDGANADFGTDITYPTNGQSGTTWWSVLQSAVQQLADRTQSLAAFASATPIHRVPLIPTLNTSSRFDVDGSGVVWVQISVASAGELIFPVGGALPVGRKITAVTASIHGESDGTLPVTMPHLQIDYLDTSTNTAGTIGSVTDPTASNATYTTDIHDFSITGLTHVINANYVYSVRFKGATGTHSATNLNLYRIFLTLGY